MSMVTKLRLLRVIEGMTATELAKLLGLPKDTVMSVEARTRIAYPKARRLLAEHYGMLESELFDTNGLALTVDASHREALRELLA